MLAAWTFLVADGGDPVQTLTSISNLIVAIAALIVASIAARFSLEQARNYMFAAPALYVDQASRSVVLRNFGNGAMLDIEVDIRIVHPAPTAETNISRSYPSIGGHDSIPLVSSAILEAAAIMAIEVELRYGNIKRKQKTKLLTLSSSQLSAI